VRGLAMKCPCCARENLPGADLCVSCGQDLTGPQRSQRLSVMEQRLLDTSLVALRPKAPIFVQPRTRLAAAIAQLCANHIGCLLVGDDGHVRGIFSERDALLRTAHRFEEVARAPVADFMTPEPEMLELDAPIAFALHRMCTHDFRHLPLTRGGLVVGLVSLRDVVAFLARWHPDLLTPGRN
jgi:CBS domain-containing protein